MMGVLLLVITHYGTVIPDTTCRNYESSLCQTSTVLLISNRLIVIGLTHYSVNYKNKTVTKSEQNLS